MQRGNIRCKCGRAAKVGEARKHGGRLYASCPAYPNACGFFRWLEPALDPATPERSAIAAPPDPAAPLTPSPSPPAASQAAPQLPQSFSLFAADTHAAHLCMRAFLVVQAAPCAAAGRHETVSLVLLPVLDLPPAACAALYQPAGERRLPYAPTAAASLQPPYACIQPWAPAPAVRDSLRRCISSDDRGGDARHVFVLDTETTGLSSTRDHVHQLSVLNVCSGQLLSLLLRACPAVLHPAAMQLCGVSNKDVHSPQRPTFLQALPLLSAFMSAGSSSTCCSERHSSSSSSNGGGGCGSGSTRACSTARSTRAPQAAGCATSAASAATSHAPEAAAGAAGESPILVAAHNARFDARLLAAEFARRALPLPAHWRWLDTLPLARSLLQGRKGGHSLGALQAHFGVHLPAGQVLHDASADVAVLAQLLPDLLKGIHSSSTVTGNGSGKAASSSNKAAGGGSSSNDSGGGSGGSGGQVEPWLQGFAEMTARKSAAPGSKAAKAAVATNNGLAALDEVPKLEAEAQRFTCPWCLQRVIA